MSFSPNLPKNRKNAKAWYAEKLTKALAVDECRLTEAKRWLAKNDLFYLLVAVLKRNDINKDWLFDRCREVQEAPNGYLDLWAREHYKALCIETPVWTTDGWKRHGDLRAGDYVFAPNGRRVQVLANTGDKLGADCYKVGNITAAGDHLWPAQVRHRPRITEGRDCYYSTEKVATRDMKAARLSHISPLHGAELSTTDPYALGVWLGDGSTGSSRITASISDAQEMAELLCGTGYAVNASTHSNAVSLRIGNGKRGDRASSDFTNGLRDIGVYKNKRIPQDYLLAAPGQRLALLQGLMDSDGHCNVRGTATFVNTNENLVDGVELLANSLGMRAHKRRYEGYWQVGFQAYLGDYCPFRLKRKRERCKLGSPNMRLYTPIRTQSVPVNCIQVEGGLYVAGRELLPTHNSTIITFGLSIQDILNDPCVTIGIFSHTRPIAKGFLRQIKREFEENEELRGLFPEIFWSKPQHEAPKWSEDDGIIVKRSTNPKEATVEAWGLVDGMPTSKHYSRLIYDDVVTEKSVTGPEMMKKTTDAWAMSLNLGARGGFCRMIGTRYHFNDTYRAVLDREAAIPRVHPATADGKMDGEPVFLTRPELVEKRRKQGPYIFGCQMLQDPIADKAQGFDKEWVKAWPGRDWSRLNLYILIDPASKKKKNSDYTTMQIIGIGEDGNYYWVAGVRDRLNLTERGKMLMKLHREYKPKGVGYEEYGLQADIEFVEYLQNEENYRFNITPLGGRISKEERIRRLVPIMEDGRWYMPARHQYRTIEGDLVDVIQTFIYEELDAFPVGTHDDLIDGASRILDDDLGAKAPTYSQARGTGRSCPAPVTEYDELRH